MSNNTDIRLAILDERLKTYKENQSKIETTLDGLDQTLKNLDFGVQINNITESLTLFNKHIDPINHNEQTVKDVERFINSEKGSRIVCKAIINSNIVKDELKAKIENELKEEDLKRYKSIKNWIISTSLILFTALIGVYTDFFVKGK